METCEKSTWISEITCLFHVMPNQNKTAKAEKEHLSTTISGGSSLADFGGMTHPDII